MAHHRYKEETSERVFPQEGETLSLEINPEKHPNHVICTPKISFDSITSKAPVSDPKASIDFASSRTDCLLSLSGNFRSSKQFKLSFGSLGDKYMLGLGIFEWGRRLFATLPSEA